MTQNICLIRNRCRGAATSNEDYGRDVVVVFCLPPNQENSEQTFSATVIDATGTVIMIIKFFVEIRDKVDAVLKAITDLLYHEDESDSLKIDFRPVYLTGCIQVLTLKVHERYARIHYLAHTYARTLNLVPTHAEVHHGASYGNILCTYII